MIWFAGYLLTGVVVGFLAGLLGIGGGMTMVPILSALFAAQAFAPDHVVHLALGTSMASIVFTATSSVREHHKLGAVDFDIVRRMAPSMVAGTLISTVATGWISQRHLALAFSAIVFAGATQILLNRKPAPGRSLPGPLGMSVVGGAIGVICGLVSAGGTFLSMPFMVFCGVPVRTAIGTGATLGIPMAAIGLVGYMISGWSVPNLPATSVGFVHLTALAGIVIASVWVAPLGARVAHRLPVVILRRIFAFFLYVLAIRMLVVFW